MIEFKKWSLGDIQKRLPALSEKDKIIVKKLHQRLCNYICLIGVKSYKKHGNYWDGCVGRFIFHLDDYNSAIHINGEYIGMGFGGSNFWISIKMYRYFIGLLYQKWLRKHRENINGS